MCAQDRHTVPATPGGDRRKGQITAEVELVQGVIEPSCVTVF